MDANYNHIIFEWGYCLRLYFADMSSKGAHSRYISQCFW
jgi:hypothetical protein